MRSVYILLPLSLGLALLLLAAPPIRPLAAEELADEAWREARQEARRLWSKAGQRTQKLKVIERLGGDDSVRALELLVQWTLRSLKLQQGPLARELADAKEDFDKVDKLMRRFYEKMPPTRAEDKNAWDRVRKIHETAQAAYGVEDAVRYALGEAFERVRDPQAVTWLRDEGLAQVQKAKHSEPAQIPIVRSLLRQPRGQVLTHALAWAQDAKRSKLRILALNWFGQHRVTEGFEVLTDALGAREMAVRRAAVAALRGLNDTRSVEPLIEALARAQGQLASEIDEVLHWYTGKSFEASAAVWRRWWQEEGTAWLEQSPQERHLRRRENLPGGTRVRFYGIPTDSHHVVFVLDRSGSMKTKAGDRSIQEKKKEEPKGPVTGDGGEDGAERRKGREAVAGDTKMEVARNQLALSVDELAKDVRFAVVFYSSDVQVWQEPPELVAASPTSKKAAKAWFMKLEPEGSTQLFAALMRALMYADTIGEDVKKPRTGADTIFLLTDGSPTDPSGQPLPQEEMEKQYAAFLEANKLYHCTVHTIGIGPGHNRSLLQRLARDTGGEYKAVGAR